MFSGGGESILKFKFLTHPKKRKKKKKKRSSHLVQKPID